MQPILFLPSGILAAPCQDSKNQFIKVQADLENEEQHDIPSAAEVSAGLDTVEMKFGACHFARGKGTSFFI